MNKTYNFRNYDLNYSLFQITKKKMKTIIQWMVHDFDYVENGSFSVACKNRLAVEEWDIQIFPTAYARSLNCSYVSIWIEYETVYVEM